jgi:hypothetical protein
MRQYIFVCTTALRGEIMSVSNKPGGKYGEERTDERLQRDDLEPALLPENRDALIG